MTRKISREEWCRLASVAKYHPPQLAQLLNVTTRHLERLVHRDLDSTPQRWMDEQRMALARDLLLRGHSVKFVALEVGFRQASHFSRHFKHHHGVNPSDFVHRHRENPEMSPTDSRCRREVS